MGLTQRLRHPAVRSARPRKQALTFLATLRLLEQRMLALEYIANEQKQLQKSWAQYAPEALDIQRHGLGRCSRRPLTPPPRESHRDRSSQAQRGARTRFHHSESPTATATSNPPAPANHDAMSTCFLTTVTWLGRSPSAPCSWSALSAL